MTPITFSLGLGKYFKGALSKVMEVFLSVFDSSYLIRVRPENLECMALWENEKE